MLAELKSSLTNLETVMSSLSANVNRNNDHTIEAKESVGGVGHETIPVKSGKTITRYGKDGVVGVLVILLATGAEKEGDAHHRIAKAGDKKDHPHADDGERSLAIVFVVLVFASGTLVEGHRIADHGDGFKETTGVNGEKALVIGL